jgi:hypothetical protein
MKDLLQTMASQLVCLQAVADIIMDKVLVAAAAQEDNVHGHFPSASQS